MELLFLSIGLGIAAAGYFIGEGLKNFKNPESSSFLDQLEKDEEIKLIPEKEVHHVLGVSKEDALKITKEHPDIPHIVINGNTYYPKTKLQQWLSDIGG